MIFSICKQFIRFGEELYVVVRSFQERPNLDVDVLKEFYGAELVLRKDQVLYLVNKIETLEYEQITTALE